MNDTDLAAARAALLEARRAARPIGPLIPTQWVPADLQQAYRLQRAMAVDPGEIRGWKISGLTSEQQRAMGVACPLAAPLLAPWVRDSGASFALKDFIRPRLECEFAFELAADLAARAAAYARAEVEAAIGALRIVVEIVDSRLPEGSPTLLQLADDLNNGGFVVGPAVAGWRHLRYAEKAIVLRWRSGDARSDLAHGTGSAILDGDPVAAVVLLANLPALRPRGLRRGDIVTTGSCTGAVAVPGIGEFEADFAALGTVRLRFVS
ncbi:MAG TPA: hypothetical protein VF319_03800 [Caldimonas sp.]